MVSKHRDPRQLSIWFLHINEFMQVDLDIRQTKEPRKSPKSVELEGDRMEARKYCEPVH